MFGQGLNYAVRDNYPHPSKSREGRGARSQRSVEADSQVLQILTQLCGILHVDHLHPQARGGV